MSELPSLADVIPIDVHRLVTVSDFGDKVGYEFQRRNPEVVCASFAWNQMTEYIEQLSAASEAATKQAVLLIDPPSLELFEKSLAALAAHGKLEDTCIVKVDNLGFWRQFQALLGEEGTGVSGMTLKTVRETCRQVGFYIDRTGAQGDQANGSDLLPQHYLDFATKNGLTPKEAQLRLLTKSWVLRCVKETLAPRSSLVALCLKKIAGVNEARVDYPLRALQSLPGYDVLWGHQIKSIPASWAPGVLILHRQFLNEPATLDVLNRFIDRGWVIVSDIDDDPHHWRGFTDNNFRAFRGVHAVTVSSLPMAEMVSEWNPNVEIFDNAIFELPQPFGEEEVGDGKIRIFFGAINRTKEWHIIAPEIFRAIREVDRKVELVVVHDKKVFESVPEDISKQFYPTLDHDAYLRVLSQCQIALLPLEDTSFNRLKSDLKFIECCAAKVVPICSPVVYDQKAEHLEIGCFAAAQEEWYDHLKRLLIDGQERIERSKKGFEYVKRSRMHCHQVEGRRAFYQSLLARRQDLEKQRLNRLRALGLA